MGASASRPLRTLAGHTGWVNSVAVSPDGQWIVSGSDDTTVRVWRLSDGSPVRTLAGHTYLVNSVAVSPDGQWIVSGSYDETVRVFPLGTATSPPVPGEAPTRFSLSQYKRLHNAQLARWSGVDLSAPAAVGGLRDDMLLALQELAAAYARAHGVADAPLHAFIAALERVWQQERRLEQMAVRLWTSLEKLNERELCSIINEGLRSEAVPDLQRPAVALTAMVQVHLNRARRGLANGPWPDGRDMDKCIRSPDGTLTRIGSFPTVAHTFYRGTGLPTDPAAAERVLGFYEALANRRRTGRVYRVPGMLATSMDQSVARGFLADPRNAGQPKILWTVVTCVDARGYTDASLKPLHVAYLSHTEGHGEEELLFSAYSAFRVESVVRSNTPDRPATPHRITIVAAYDNQAEEEGAPTAPWQ